MNASFDGVRKQLVYRFNELAKTELSDEQKNILREMRDVIVGLLCMYCEEWQPKDGNSLIDKIELETVINEAENE